MAGAGGHLFGGFFAFLFGVAVIAGIVLLVIWAVRASTRGHHTTAVATAPQPVAQAAGVQDAIALARTRYASGEITKEQYEEIVRTLSS